MLLCTSLLAALSRVAWAEAAQNRHGRRRWSLRPVRLPHPCAWHARAARRLGPKGRNGNYTRQWERTLREDCPSCPWWDDDRPLKGGRDDLDVVLGPRLNGEGGKWVDGLFVDEHMPTVRAREPVCEEPVRGLVFVQLQGSLPLRGKGAACGSSGAEASCRATWQVLACAAHHSPRLAVLRCRLRSCWASGRRGWPTR